MQLAIRALISLKPIKIHNNQAATPSSSSLPSHPTRRWWWFQTGPTATSGLTT